MSKFSIDTGIAGKAFQCKSVHVGTPDGILAWPFENQTGKYGRYLNSSVLYCGVSGGIKVIPAGTSINSLKVGVKGEDVVFKILTGGTNYTSGVVLDTGSSNPFVPAANITVKVVASAGGVVSGIEVVDGGSSNNPGDIITIIETGRPAGSEACTFQIIKLERGIPSVIEEVSYQVVAGQFLPLAVDYITNTDTTATRDGIIVCK